MNRREALGALLLALAPSSVLAAAPSVSTLIGTGSKGFSDREVNNPYGLVIGPDRMLYFCDLDNQRIRRLDFATKRMTTIAGTGEKGYTGDGGPATAASLNMPHELRFDAKGDIYVAERDNHVIRKIDRRTGIISTVAGTGAPGFSGDGGPGTAAAFHTPLGIAIDNAGSLYISDFNNNRIRKLAITANNFPTTTIGASSVVQNILLQTTAAETITSITMISALSRR